MFQAWEINSFSYERMIIQTQEYFYLLIVISQLFFFAAFFLAAGDIAGRLLPNDPLKRLPLAVFLSPLPILINFNLNDLAKIRCCN